MHFLLQLLFWNALGNAEKNTSVNIYSFTSFTVSTTVRSIVAAQQLYLNELNANNTSKYKFNLIPLDIKGELVHSIKLSIQVLSNENQLIIKENSTHLDVVLPIILGASYSSINVITVPIFSSSDFGQMSAASTSVVLSNSESYPFFYRTIPADNIQAQAIIKLCKLFNWDKIIIVYVNDPYGVYLNVNVMDLALDSNIETYSVSFEMDDITSYQHAAKQIKELGVFTILLIAHIDSLPDFIEYGLKEEDVFGYPYYYMSGEAVFDKGSIQLFNLQKYLKGFVGSTPWVPDSIYDRGEGSYSYNYNHHHNKSQSKSNEFNTLWNETFMTNPNLVYNITFPTIYSYFGWDGIQALVDSLFVYDSNFGMETIWNGTYNQSFVMKNLNRILINNTNFIGTTGNVSFDNNGDRKNGQYAFANIIDDNGTIKYFGVYSNSSSNDIDIYNDIVWPEKFAKLGIIPQSDVIVDIKLKDLNSVLITVMQCLLILSTFFGMIAIGLILKLRNIQLIKAVSWKLTLLSTIGSIMFLFGLMLYPISEKNHNKGINWIFVCNFRWWLITVSLTVLFMPSFLKIFRIGQIFGVFNVAKNLKPQQLTDVKLICITLVCVMIDIIILSIFFIHDPLTRECENAGNEQVIDELRRVQYTYGVCNSNNWTTAITTIGVWKLIQLFFGCYSAAVVTQVSSFFHFLL